VAGWDELTFAETPALDKEYVLNRSLRFDLEILCRNAVAVLRQEGA
jgi:lipopolysaccharide/colanic/teichoic acid biosynthesis glycosyltransferase